MSKTAVIVPFKARGVKSRMSAVATPWEREELAALLLKYVLGVLESSELIESTFVVTSDKAALSLASGLSARGVPESSDRGVNEAVETGLAAARGFEDALVLPSDLPLIRRSDISALVRLKSGGLDAVISPSRVFDGTNAYLFSVGDKVPLLYDSDSFWGHLAGLARRGLKAGVCTRPGLTFDLDSEADLAALSATNAKSAPASLARRLVR